MNNKKLRVEDIFAVCLDEIQSGRATMEECIQRFPSIREELAELFSTVDLFIENEAVKPRALFKRSSSARLMRKLPDPQSVTFFGNFRQIMQNVFLFRKRSFAMVWVLVITLTAAMLGGGGVVYASADSLPGDSLYSVKNAVEDVRLAIADDDLSLQMQFANERLDEMDELNQSGRYEDMMVALNGYKEILEDIQVGAQEQVRSESQQGELDGEMIQQTLRIQQMLKVCASEQTQQKLQEMLKTAEQLQANRSEDAGKPEDAGQSEEAGQPEEAGQLEGTGESENAGQPEDAGQPENAGQQEGNGQQGEGQQGSGQEQGDGQSGEGRQGEGQQDENGNHDGSGPKH